MMCTATVLFDGEKYVLLLCAWKAAFTKSSHIYYKLFLSLNYNENLSFVDNSLTTSHHLIYIDVCNTTHDY